MNSPASADTKNVSPQQFYVGDVVVRLEGALRVTEVLPGRVHCVNRDGIGAWVEDDKVGVVKRVLVPEAPEVAVAALVEAEPLPVVENVEPPEEAPSKRGGRPKGSKNKK